MFETLFFEECTDTKEKLCDVMQIFSKVLNFSKFIGENSLLINLLDSTFFFILNCLNSEKYLIKLSAYSSSNIRLNLNIKIH